MWSVLIRLTIVIVLGIVIITWYMIPDRFFAQGSSRTSGQISPRVIQSNQEKNEKREVEPLKNKDVVVEIDENIKQSVPFMVQAPHAQWTDPRYQDACEEASMVMAHGWLNNDSNISKNDAEEQIEKLFVFEKEQFGDVLDTSIADTALIFEKYYNHAVEVRKNVSMDDLYTILAQDDSIIIAPTNGKFLKNPNFTDGGPDRHMLVVLGYDKKNGEFITNDPGTRLGRGYKYKDSTLFNAIRDYKTGNKADIMSTEKNVIVIKN